MEADKIVRFVNHDLALGMKDWRVTATVGDTARRGYPMGWLYNDPDRRDVVTLHATWDNVDTDIQNAKRGYPEVLPGISRAVVVPVADIHDTEDILREVEALLSRAFKHEVMEAMRVRSDGLRAPFHPHRADGLRRWGLNDRDTTAFLLFKRPQDVTPADVEEVARVLV